jgi:hypothetical protein
MEEEWSADEEPATIIEVVGEVERGISALVGSSAPRG